MGRAGESINTQIFGRMICRCFSQIPDTPCLVYPLTWSQLGYQMTSTQPLFGDFSKGFRILEKRERKRAHLWLLMAKGRGGGSLEI